MAQSILFVCMGNICRSPAAEGVFLKKLADAGMGDQVKVDSAGTIGYHAGKPADARMRTAAAKRGYELSSRSRQVQKSDLDDFDLVLAMDRDNLADLERLHSSPSAEVKLFSACLGDTWPTDVPDPYYGGDDGFEYVLDMIEAACPELLQACEKE